MNFTNSKLRLSFEYIKTTSYVGTKSGKLTISNLNPSNIKGKHVLVCEDIYDTGKSMQALLDAINEHGPKNMKTTVLLHKRNPGNLVYKWKADFIGYFINNSI